jgi:hypothetical protein
MSTTKKKNAKLDLVKSKSGLKEKVNKNTAEAEIMEKIKELGDISELVDCPSIILQICSYVENLNKSSLKGKEKQDLVIKLITQIFPTLNKDNDIRRIRKTIDFLCSQGNVKAISNAVVATKTVCSWLSKKL